LSTHADHFENHASYSISAYAKGAVFLNQLEYVIGKPAFDKGMLAFFEAWKFKHPDDNDFIRVMEKVSGLELDWYKDYMIYTTKTIDYAIDTVESSGQTSTITLHRLSAMPMPIDIIIICKGGTTLYYTIPLDIMLGAKTETAEDGSVVQVLPDWTWVDPYYSFQVPLGTDQMLSVSIDPSRRMADLDRENNSWILP